MELRELNCRYHNANRGSTTVPDVEDINRDNITINAYYEYSIDVAKSYYWAELYNDIRNTQVTLQW
jgi:hypothetical protein